MKRNRYGEIQQKIYAFVLKKMKLEKRDSLYYDIYEEMHSSDRFWTSSFDEVYEAAGRDKKKRLVQRTDQFEDLVELTSEAVEQVYLSITDYYGNSWNFAPGYKGVKLPADLKFTRDDIIKLMRTF